MNSSVSSISSCRPRAQPATPSGLQGLAYDLKACIPAKPAYLRAAKWRSPLGLLRLCLTVAAWSTGHVVRKLTFHAWGMHARVREDQALARFGLTDVSFMHEPHGLSAILDQDQSGPVSRGREGTACRHSMRSIDVGCGGATKPHSAFHRRPLASGVHPPVAQIAVPGSWSRSVSCSPAWSDLAHAQVGDMTRATVIDPLGSRHSLFRPAISPARRPASRPYDRADRRAAGRAPAEVGQGPPRAGDPTAPGRAPTLRVASTMRDVRHADSGASARTRA